MSLRARLTQKGFLNQKLTFGSGYDKISQSSTQKTKNSQNKLLSDENGPKSDVF